MPTPYSYDKTTFNKAEAYEAAMDTFGAKLGSLKEVEKKAARIPVGYLATALIAQRVARTPDEKNMAETAITRAQYQIDAHFERVIAPLSISRDTEELTVAMRNAIQSNIGQQHLRRQESEGRS